MSGAPRGIVGAAAISAVLAGGIMILAVAVLRPALRVATYSGLVTEEHRAACELAPDAWGWESGGLSFHAYDRAGHSANPTAPAIEDQLLAQVTRTNAVAERAKEGRMVVLIPAAIQGPCALLRITTNDIIRDASSWVLPVLAVSIFASMLLAAGLASAFVLRPLLARINALASSARKVGTAEFRPAAAGEDALGTIAQVLIRSHERVVANREALVERNRALEEHLAGIAHDLRTPLASMYLTLELLAKDAESPYEDEARRAIADVVYLSSLVENLHQAARLRQEVEITSGEVELAELVRRLERRFAIIGRHAKVELAANIPDDEIWAACTPALAERAISNVVQNAIEHNDQLGHVAITLAHRESRFELVVADDGPGLPESTLASFDEATFLVEGPRPRGPGLGMLITAEISSRAGWTLSYEALEPRGVRVLLAGPILRLARRGGT